MTKAQMVKEAMEYNRCAIIGRRDGKIPHSVAGFIERRDFLIKMARKA